MNNDRATQFMGRGRKGKVERWDGRMGDRIIECFFFSVIGAWSL